MSSAFWTKRKKEKDLALTVKAKKTTKKSNSNIEEQNCATKPPENP